MCYELTSTSGKLTATVLAFGATLTSVRTPNKHGTMEEVTLGLIDWEAPGNPCMNCVIGRIAGRTSSPVVIDGRSYNLPGCDGGGGGIKPETNLHGGMNWNSLIWKVTDHSPTFVTLSLVCDEPSLPGTLTTTMTYRIVEENTLRFEYHSTCTETTLVSLTNHTYWNLSGNYRDKSISKNHEIQINADNISTTTSCGDGLGTGEKTNIKNTIRDTTASFQLMKDVIEHQKTANPNFPHGEEFLLNKNIETEDVLAATVRHKISGRIMSVFTTEPAIQTYYSTLLGGEIGRDLVVLEKHGGLCLEATRRANTIDDSRILRKGEVYKQVTRHVFSIMEES
ncbi:hypothetical protein ScalyP_jg505 [Parmales sp. scaly parma]|nr:hypothetical protein ScalyP_jg505 [Parmales sp. scaly parma]